MDTKLVVDVGVICDDASMTAAMPRDMIKNIHCSI
jgi:hypothetical protein